MELARFQVKYNVDCGWEQMLHVILSKDKYLHLGHYLLKNREDWSDGCDYAERGLDGFVAETPEDNKIEEELLGLIGENWSGDGRSFRDCVHSYDYLFGKVEENLFKDYELAKSKIND